MVPAIKENALNVDNYNRVIKIYCVIATTNSRLINHHENEL